MGPNHPNASSCLVSGFRAVTPGAFQSRCLGLATLQFDLKHLYSRPIFFSKQVGQMQLLMVGFFCCCFEVFFPKRLSSSSDCDIRWPIICHYVIPEVPPDRSFSVTSQQWEPLGAWRLENGIIHFCSCFVYISWKSSTRKGGVARFFCLNVFAAVENVNCLVCIHLCNMTFSYLSC